MVPGNAKQAEYYLWIICTSARVGGTREKLIGRLRFITVASSWSIKIGNFQILPVARCLSGNLFVVPKGRDCLLIDVNILMRGVINS